MRFYHSVMDCCGILGIQGVSGLNTPQLFWDGVIHVVKTTMTPFAQTRGNGSLCVDHIKKFSLKGAIVQINTSNQQIPAEHTISEIGFTPVFKHLNTNSYNQDTVWLMKADEFWAKYRVEVVKKSNFQLFPTLFPEENPDRAPVPKSKLKIDKGPQDQLYNPSTGRYE